MQRDTSFSAPPSATFRRDLCQDPFEGCLSLQPMASLPQPLAPNNNNNNNLYGGASPQHLHGLPVGLRLSPVQPMQPLQQQPMQQQPRQYEFRRRQLHAQSFHYGTTMRHHLPEVCGQLAGAGSRWRAEPQHHHEPESIEPSSGLGQPLASQKSEEATSGSPIIKHSDQQQQQHLLERHRSLPRSLSRLHRRDSGAPLDELAMGADGGQTTRSGNSGGRRRKQPRPGSIEGQIDETGAGQVMDGPREGCHFPAEAGDERVRAGSAALASIIKSMDRPEVGEAEAARAEVNSVAAIATDWDAEPTPTTTTTTAARPASELANRKSRTEVADDASALVAGVDNSSQASRAIKATSAKVSLPSVVKTESVGNKAILCTYSYMTDDQLLQSNIIVFLLNLTLWLPFILLQIIGQYREQLTQELKDFVWWLATLNCCSCSYVYAITNKDFREAFNKLFYYCCCKSHVTFARKTPIFRRQLDLDSRGNLRIHIIPGLNVYSNKLSKGGDPVPGPGGGSQSALGGASHHHHQFGSGSGGLQPASGDGGHGSATGSGAASGSAHRHHMSVGGGFGGPLFASSKLYAGPSGSSHPADSDRPHSGRRFPSGHDKSPAS